MDCPDAPPANTQDGAMLAFCSPINHGFVGGPYGTHIVLIGENLPVGKINWFYIGQNSPLDAKKVKNCFTNEQSCPLSPLADQATRPTQSGWGFGWTWNAASPFPKTKANYSLTANINTGYSFIPVASSIPFSLLTTQVPCVVASNGSYAQTSTSATSLLNNSTLVNNALTYGCTQQDNTRGLIITMRQTIQPLATSGQMLGILSLLALVPIIVALILYLVYAIRRQIIEPSPSDIDVTAQPTYPLLNEQQWDELERQIGANQPETVLSKNSMTQWKKKLVEQEQLDIIISTALKELLTNAKLWKKILKDLHKFPTKNIPSEAMAEAFANLQVILHTNPNQVHLLCGKTIILYEILLPIAPPETVCAADIAYNLGFAYSNLSAASPLTRTALLDMAIKRYDDALKIYESRKMHKQQIYTLSNKSIVCTILSKLASKNKDRYVKQSEKCLQQKRELEKDNVD